MKKFINEYKYKALRSKSETEASKPTVESYDQAESRNKVDPQKDMGVFKWLRRERVTVTTHHVTRAPSPEDANVTQVGTIRTEEYKRDLAEFQARRSSGHKELPDTPVKKKCGRHSLPVSCTDCSTAHDHTFNYEKKSAAKYKKKNHKRTRSATPERKRDLPSIQFLFQNQVFMPGNMFATSSFSDPQRTKRHSRQREHRSPEFTAQRHIDFNEDELKSPPLFFKNNSLPYDVENFLDGSREEIDGVRASGDVHVSSQNSSDGVKDDSGDDKLWEVMSELKSFDRWADEQLGQNVSKSDDNKSGTSAYGLPIASACSLDIEVDTNKLWNHGKWGVVPVQIKKLAGVTIGHVKRKLNTEINILRKCRHPNIILLMGLYPDIQNNVHIICERCVDSLFGILHVQGRILSAQTSVHYALDIANALVFLQMQGYIHTSLASSSIMITSHNAAKLADLGSCVKLPKTKAQPKQYEIYSPEPQYVNISGVQPSNTPESEPLISAHPSEAYLASHAVAKDHETFHNSEQYRWQAPELFEPEDGMVYPCAKSDVYSLCLVLWESCNASVPWKTLTYEKLKEQYTLWKTCIRLPTDGTYPGCLLALLQSGLELQRSERIDLTTLQNTLYNVKNKLDDLEYIIIPARVSKKKSTFSSTAWDTNSPTDDSECQSPIAQNIQHKAVVHTRDIDSSTESDRDSRSFPSPLYETIRKEKSSYTFTIPETCYMSDDDNIEVRPILKYGHLPEKDFSSVCSTPISKIRARIKDLGTPGVLHRSDSTEYCSILSPDCRQIGFNDDSNKQQSAERSTAKLSRSFTPKSYKPLHIKVPEFNLDSVKSILKDQSDTEKSSYNFDIKNYSLPTTPIARSNKLRKNAWLSGELNLTKRSTDKLKDILKTQNKDDFKNVLTAPVTPAPLSNSPEKEDEILEHNSYKQCSTEEQSPESVDMGRDSYTGLRRIDRPQDFSPETYELPERTSSWSFKSSSDRPSSKYKVEDDILANLNVKPLVAIHERWIYEANRKTGRSMSLPENNRLHMTAVKPASHCVDTMQSSLPQLNVKRPVPKPFRTHPVSPSNGKNGVQWEQFCQARETIAKSINFTARDPERFHTLKKDTDRGTTTVEETPAETKKEQGTDTESIEDFIRDLIRKEFQHLLHEISDETSNSTLRKSEEILDKGVANIMENLKNGEDKPKQPERETVKSFSRLKINGNNKPLLQITFSRSGENSLHVLDNCVNVTICDGNAGAREKLNQSLEDTLTADDGHVHALKRCQAFSAIQEARSTEDLYIDDDLSTQMQENFGGKVKLIPLHGSLHEILCEKEDECCLIKVKQENGCDTIYFRCDNSDTESRDAIDGCSHENLQDTVVFKRSISLIEERVQRIMPKDKRTPTPIVCRRAKQSVENNKTRPKSEVFIQNICKESRALSNSSPSLTMKDRNDEVEVNIENVMCYQDSSSDECLRCQAESDDFELLEKKIEEDLANSNMSSLTCGCLEKISEENLSVFNDEIAEKVDSF